MGYIRNIMCSPELKNKGRMNEKDFTRNRKVGFLTLVCIILNMIKKSTQLEIDDFLKQFRPEKNNCSTYTKQSFSESRKKLSPEVFVILNDAFVEKFYEDDDFKKYKGYRLLAIDGSYNEVPNNVETRKAYGYVKNNSKDLKLARTLCSNVYDVENRILVSAILGRCDGSERKLAMENINKVKKHEGASIKDLILFDRGYPSLSFINFLELNNIKYLMRTCSSFLKEVKCTNTEDENVEVEITQRRVKQLKSQGTPMPLGTILKFRVINIALENGENETLITNMSKEELKYEESKEVYFKRWGIETKFDELKNKFQIENFSGERPLLIEQDFYATLLLSNMASTFEQDATEELKMQNSGKSLKYDYKINKNILVGKMKDNLIEMLLEENEEKKSIMFSQFINELKRSIVPIINGRIFERKKVIKANKYSKARRRAL